MVGMQKRNAACKEARIYWFLCGFLRKFKMSRCPRVTISLLTELVVLPMAFIYCLTFVCLFQLCIVNWCTVVINIFCTKDRIEMRRLLKAKDQDPTSWIKSVLAAEKASLVVRDTLVSLSSSLYTVRQGPSWQGRILILHRLQLGSITLQFSGFWSS